MSTPDRFVGKFTMKPDGEGEDLPIWFYRREDPDYASLGEFIDSITPDNFGWDKPSRRLFYKDPTGKCFIVNFEPLT